MDVCPCRFGYRYLYICVCVCVLGCLCVYGILAIKMKLCHLQQLDIQSIMLSEISQRQIRSHLYVKTKKTDQYREQMGGCLIWRTKGALGKTGDEG